MQSQDIDADPQLFRFRFGSAEFDESRFVLLVGGQTVEVQRKPLEVLALLLRNSGEVVTREELLERVWDNRPTVEHVINNALAKLRSALGADNAASILTQPRVGYRFEGKLERTPVGRAVHSELQLASGGTVPGRTNFILRRMLGRSDDHEVWLARHERTGEERVYKFCIAGGRLTGLKREATLARVLREQLGPREDFVRLIDWNFESAPYYLESEFGGSNLREWAAEQNRLTAMESPDRLDLFLQIADAVGAAHSVGVIHKDIKPSNVLVSPLRRGWRVKIADLGSGRLIDSEKLSDLAMSRLGFTVTEQPGSDSDGGTPLYLAPEQLAGGPATILSDVYALGLLLFQLTTGDLTRPLVPGWQRHISDPLLREDIAAATDVDAAHRTASALILAQQLRALPSRRQQCEEHQRLEQERLDLLERQKRIAARRPWVQSTIIVLLCGIAVAGTFYWRALRNAEQLESENEVVARLNSLLTADLISAANPDLSGNINVTISSAVQSAAQHIDQELPRGPFAVRGALHSAMQDAFSGLSDYQRAVVEGQAALRDFSAAGKTERDADVMTVNLRLASDLAQVSRLDEADKALSRAQANLDSDSSATLRARAQMVIGNIEAVRLNFTAAIDAFETALKILKGSGAADSKLMAHINFELGDLLKLAGRYAESESVLRTLLAEQLQREGADSIRADFTRVALASTLGYQGRFAEAEALAEHASARYQQDFGPNHRRTLEALLVLAGLDFQQEHYLKAAAVYGDIYQRMVASSGPQQELAVTMGADQAMALDLAGKTQDAVPLFRAQLHIARQFLPENAPRVQGLRYHLADCKLDLHQADAEVAELLKDLDPSALNAAQQESDWEGRIAYQSGRLALLQGRRKEAREFLDRALANITEHNSHGKIKPEIIQALLQRLGSAHQ